MNKPDSKQKTKRKPAIRPIRFSLKLKVTILVFIILITTVSAVSNFIIHLENNIIDSQLQDTMRVYLETFRKNVEIQLIQNNDPGDLNKFLVSYKNIKNFEMAMFVDNTGKILIHTEPYSVGRYVARTSLLKFRSAFEDRLYIDHFVRNIEDLPESISENDFDAKIMKFIKNDKDKKLLLSVYEKGKQDISYQLKDSSKPRDRREANKILTSIGYQKLLGYDGFMPIFHPLMLSNTNESRQMGEMIDLYKNGKLFQNEPLMGEVYNNFSLIRDFDRLTESLIGKGSTNARILAKKSRTIK